MESPVARIFGINSSVVPISIGYTATEHSESPLPTFFGEISDSPMTIPMDRSRLLSKLLPNKNTKEASGSFLPPKSASEKQLPTQPLPAKAAKRPKSPAGKPSKIQSGHVESSNDVHRVEIRLDDFASMMLDAASTQRLWVQDFADDLVAIPKDLYEVMLAYQRMRRAG